MLEGIQNEASNLMDSIVFRNARFRSFKKGHHIACTCPYSQTLTHMRAHTHTHTQTHTNTHTHTHTPAESGAVL